MNKEVRISLVLGFAALSMASEGAFATCKDFPKWGDFQGVAMAAVLAEDSGYNLPMWVTAVDETGKVCLVVNTNGNGHNSGASWLGSRDISAQKANAANAFSIDHYVISTANLYTPTNQGQSLFGLQFSNPIDGSMAYVGNPNKYGTKNDPLKNKRIGGINVFGGGLAVYQNGNRKIGAIGVSGDTSCTDHAVAWRIRNALSGHPGGAGGGIGITSANFKVDGTAVSVNGGAGAVNTYKLKGDEMIIIDNTNGSSDAGEGWNGWAHPECPRNPAASANGTAATGIIRVKNK